MSKKDLPYQPFFWSDWFGDSDVQSLNHADRCVWIEMIGRMWQSTNRGYLLVGGETPTAEQLARILGFGADAQALAQALASIEKMGLFSRDESGTIFSRRILRDIAVSDSKSKSGRAGGRASAQAKINDLLKPNGIGIGIGISSGVNTGDSLLERIIASGPEKWQPEAIQATLKWSEWSRDITSQWRDQLPDLAAKYKTFTDGRFKKQKIEAMSLRNWLQGAEYAKEIPAVKSERRRYTY